MLCLCLSLLYASDQLYANVCLSMSVDHGNYCQSKPSYLARSLQSTIPFATIDELHLPVLFKTVPLESKVAEQVLMAQTAATRGDDNLVDLIGADRKGFPTRPN